MSIYEQDCSSKKEWINVEEKKKSSNSKKNLLDKIIDFFKKKNKERFIKEVNKIRTPISDEKLLETTAKEKILEVLFESVGNSSFLNKNSALILLSIDECLEEARAKIYEKIFLIVKDKDVDHILQKALHKVLRILPALPETKVKVSVGFVCAIYRKHGNKLENKEKERLLAKELAKFIYEQQCFNEWVMNTHQNKTTMIKCEKTAPPEEIIKKTFEMLREEAQKNKLVYQGYHGTKEQVGDPTKSRQFREEFENEINNLIEAKTNKKNHA